MLQGIVNTITEIEKRVAIEMSMKKKLRLNESKIKHTIHSTIVKFGLYQIFLHDIK